MLLVYNKHTIYRAQCEMSLNVKTGVSHAGLPRGDLFK